MTGAGSPSQTRQGLVMIAAVIASTALSPCRANDEAIPFPEALAAAAVTVSGLDSLLDDSLILGNGDINALLYSDGGHLALRLTKNDVWDARLDTSNDPPLPTLERIEELAFGDWPDRDWVLPKDSKWTGPDSYHATASPCPRACAVVRLGGGRGEPAWRQMRAEGTHNAWGVREGAAVMSIRGRGGASNGWSCSPLDLSTDQFPRLQVRLSGTKNARFFVDVMGADGKVLLGSKWQKTPTRPQDYTFELPGGAKVASVVLYTWTDDGETAENRFEALHFEGRSGSRASVPVDLTKVDRAGPAARLDIRRGVLHVAGLALGEPETRVRALSGRNVFLVESALPARLDAVVSEDLPAVERGIRGEVKWLLQKIPGDLDWGGLLFAVALAARGEKKTIALVTSRESDDIVAAAVDLARSTLEADTAATVRRHESDWRTFWLTSGVEIDDAVLEAAWYRNLYFLRCVSRPGAVPPGLFAGLVDDRPAWHGDYHTNYNIQQTFWTAYVTNHCELAEPYDRLIRAYAPRARWLSRRVFDCGGAYYPHVIFAYEPPDPAACRSRNGRQYLHHVWGFTIGVAGFTVQPLWWRYKYEPSQRYLEETAYPAVRDVAVFYSDFIDRCPSGAGGKVILGPSVSPEHWGWTPSFERNQDGTFDIAMVRFTLLAAIEGATRLGSDPELVERFQKALEKLPEYPLTDRDEPVVVDVAGATPITYNIAVPAVPVFPGDVVTWWSPEKEKELFARTIESLQWNGNNSTVMLAVARARLSLPGTAEWLHAEVAARLRPNGTLTLNRHGHHFNSFGHYTEQFAVTMAVSELLLQSVGDVVRIFPAWPSDRRARFRGLRAQGGFLVSASHDASAVEWVEVEATTGGRLRLASPWLRLRVERNRDGDPTPLRTDTRGVVEVDTRRGEHLVFRPAR